MWLLIKQDKQLCNLQVICCNNWQNQFTILNCHYKPTTTTVDKGLHSHLDIRNRSSTQMCLIIMCPMSCTWCIMQYKIMQHSYTTYTKTALTLAMVIVQAMSSKFNASSEQKNCEHRNRWVWHAMASVAKSVSSKEWCSLGRCCNKFLSNGFQFKEETWE